MPNTNFQTFHQMGSAISNVVKQASGRDPVQNIDMDFVTVAQNKTIGEMIITGNPTSFHTGNSVPIQRILLGMNPIQSGSGDPSPENVRPISGRSKVNLYASGENIWDFVAYDGGRYNPDIGETFALVKSEDQPTDNGDGTFTLSFTTSWKYKTFIFPVVVGNTYYRYIKILRSGNRRISVGSLDENYKVLSKSNETTSSDITISTTYTPTAAKYWYLVVSNGSSTNIDVIVQEPHVTLGSTLQPYSPYAGITIPVTFPDPPGTVYQGTLNLISGQLTVTHLMQTFTGAESEEWLNTYESNGFRIASRGMKIALLNTGLCNWLPILSEVGNEMGVALGMNDSDIYVRHITDNLEIADLTEWKAYLAEHPLEIFYPLEPAQYYQVTPQDLNTLAGDNVIMTDADTLEVMYYQYGEVI